MAGYINLTRRNAGINKRRDIKVLNGTTFVFEAVEVMNRMITTFYSLAIPYRGGGGGGNITQNLALFFALRSFSGIKISAR